MNKIIFKLTWSYPPDCLPCVLSHRASWWRDDDVGNVSGGGGVLTRVIFIVWWRHEDWTADFSGVPTSSQNELKVKIEIKVAGKSKVWSKGCCHYFQQWQWQCRSRENPIFPVICSSDFLWLFVKYVILTSSTPSTSADYITSVIVYSAHLFN